MISMFLSQMKTRICLILREIYRLFTWRYTFRLRRKEKTNMDFERKTISELMGMKSPGGRWGIEVKLEGRGATERIPEGWVPHNEGSLRNGGVEYVLPHPL